MNFCSPCLADLNSTGDESSTFLCGAKIQDNNDTMLYVIELKDDHQPLRRKLD